jgi:dissimilatory sulfite reductase (desulfoviridin) alpha/beta subunit
VIRALDVCVSAILSEKREKRFGVLVEKLGIEEFKRRLTDKEHTPLKRPNNKVVQSEVHN